MNSRRKQRKLEEDEKKLYFAISDNDPSKLQSLIYHGIDIDMKFNGSNQWGKSALHLCCEKGHLECARLLVTAGAQTSQQDGWFQTPLMYSVCTERPDMVDFLIHSGCSLDTQDRYLKTALHFAVSNTEPECLHLLLNGGADVDSYDEIGRTPLWVAMATDGHLNVGKCLIEAGADVNHQDIREKRTPLQVAIKYSGNDVLQYVQLMLENGANVNTVDAYGRTPMTNLIYRQEPPNLQVAQLLLAAGYDVNYNNKPSRTAYYHGTSLKIAAERGSVPYVRLLLQAGVDPDIYDMFMATPLMTAAQNNHISVVRALLSVDCRTDNVGLCHINHEPVPATAFHCAILHSNWDIAQLLALYGQDLRKEDYLMTNHNVPNSLVENFEFWGWLRDIMVAGPSLLELCRKEIRKMLRPGIEDKVSLLLIPPRIKDYLLMTDLLSM